MRINKYLSIAAAVVSIAFVSGCEWSSGGGASSWSDAYNWVNFSGTYRGLGGGVLVTDYSTTPGTPGTTNDIKDQVVGSTQSGVSTYSGSLGNVNIRNGSVTITTGIFSLQDDGAGKLSGGGKVGTINYGTGAWSIDLQGEFPDAGTPIKASYEYVVEGASGSAGAGSGASGVTIYSFVIWQTGEGIQITDNNGSTYNGNFGSVSGTYNGGTNSSPGLGETVTAQFSAEGVSAAGFRVTMAGNFQGVVGGTDANKYLENRQMFGTWIEDGGRTGDINGETSPIAISGGDTGGDTAATTTTE
jgi:hypothetical protein